MRFKNQYTAEGSQWTSLELCGATHWQYYDNSTFSNFKPLNPCQDIFGIAPFNYKLD